MRIAILLLVLATGLVGCAQAKCTQTSTTTQDLGLQGNSHFITYYRTASGHIVTGVPGLQNGSEICVQTDK